MVAAWALLFWNLAEPGHLRDALFLFAGVTWLISLAVNLSPFMRFDGYYLLMDLWGIPNLQTRAFALASWKLRGLLFRPDQPAQRDLRTTKKLPESRMTTVPLSVFQKMPAAAEMPTSRNCTFNT